MNLERGNCLLFALKYRLSNKDSQIQVKWNKQAKLPSFRIIHRDASIRYRRVDSNSSALWFKGKVTVLPQKESGTFNHIEGDLLDLFDHGNFTAIAHGCNLQGAMYKGMAGGIAGIIAKRYPGSKEVDRKVYEECIKFTTRPNSYLGTVAGYATPTNSGTIFNVYTQLLGGPDFRLSALETAVSKLNQIGCIIFTETLKRPHIGFPEIGCGIGGGSLDEVIPVLQRLTKYWDVTLVSLPK